jgi:tRNA(fMet)-specific endonuclease VapC
MSTITAQELRNHGGEILSRVVEGETVVVVQDGAEVAEFRPLRRRALSASELISRRASLPFVDPTILRSDIDSILVAASEAESAARQEHLERAQADFDALPFDADAARAFGRVAASLRSYGRKRAARGFDALIAATAISNAVPLYTCNPSDFAGISELNLVALPHPDHS